jgi:O-antigen/teichoic acid export membrane protein
MKKLTRITFPQNRCVIGVLNAFLTKVGGAAFSFLFSVLLARHLGASGTGVYFIAITIINVGATVARFGLDNAVLRFASIAHAKGESSTLSALYRQGMGLVVVVGTFVSVAMWFGLPFVPLGDGREEMEGILPLMLIALVPTALVTLQGEYYKAVGSPGIATFVQSMALPMILASGAVLFFWWVDPDIGDFAALYLFAVTASILFAVFIWTRRYPGSLRDAGYFDFRLLLRTSLPLLWIASMNLFMGWTDILTLGIFTDSATVGVYGVANRISSLTAFVLIAVNSVTAPRFAALHVQGQSQDLEKLAQQSAAWMLLAVAPVIFVLLAFPEWILQIFGKDFIEGAVMLQVLAIAQLVNVAVGSVGYLLMMTGYETLMRNNILISGILNLVGNIVLVPTYGAVGAAVSTAFSLAFMNLCSYVLVIKKLNINTLGYIFKRVAL